MLLAAGIDVVAETATLATAGPAGQRTGADGYVLAPSHPDVAPAAEPLTSREIEVLHILTEGLPNKAIARRLGISDQTVKSHIASICGKLGVNNRTGAVRLAIERGLVAV